MHSLAPEIKAAGMEGYFDYKAYGRDEAINSYDIGDHGFVNKRISIDVEKYSYEEIQNQLKENGLDESMEYKKKIHGSQKKIFGQMKLPMNRKLIWQVIMK